MFDNSGIYGKVWNVASLVGFDSWNAAIRDGGHIVGVQDRFESKDQAESWCREFAKRRFNITELEIRDTSPN